MALGTAETLFSFLFQDWLGAQSIEDPPRAIELLSNLEMEVTFRKSRLAVDGVFQELIDDPLPRDGSSLTHETGL